jgi:HK97 family phage major capsid protein
MRMQELQEQRTKALLDAKALAEKAEAEDRGLEAEEKGQIERMLQVAEGLKEQIAKLEEDARFVKSVADMTAGLELQEIVEAKEVPMERKTWGQRVLGHPDYQAWMQQIAPKGRVPESLKGFHSPVLEFGSIMAEIVGRKTLVTGDSATSAGAFVETDYTGLYEPMGRYPLTIRELVSVRQTTSDLVSFVRQTAKVTQADTVAEANVTTYAGSSGEVEGAKPEGAVAFEQVTAAVKTIAVWIPATKRALSDASQIRGIIDQELRSDIAEEFEDQIINGAGAGEDFTGILNTANILTQAWDTDIFTTARKAITALRVDGRSVATAWAMHPEDYEAIELSTDNDGRFYYGGPVTQGQKFLWGVPIVQCESLTQGTAILGDWRKAVVWDREMTNISMTDSHEDFFTRNMIAILAEMRAAFGVLRPTAFVQVTMESGS